MDMMYPGGLIRNVPPVRSSAAASPGMWGIKEALQTRVPSFSYRTTVGSDTDAASYTFNTVDIGAPAPDRLIILGADAVTATISSLTVNGIPAVQQVNASGVAMLWTVRVPNGTTATIIATMSGTAARCAMSVFACYGITNEVPYDTATDTTDPGNIDIDITGRCIAIGVGYSNTTTGSTVATWTGLTERFDGLPGTQITYLSTAADQFNSTEPGRTVTCDWNNATTPFFCSGAWK
jgi:hypothetical protein